MCLTEAQATSVLYLRCIKWVASEVPGDFHCGFCVVAGSRMARGIAVRHLLVFGVSDLGQP